MDTFNQAIERGAFIFGYDGDGRIQERSPTSIAEQNEFRRYSRYCEANGLPQVKIERPKRGLVAVEIDRIFCPEKNCSGPHVPEALDGEYCRLVGFFASHIVDPRNVKPSWSIPHNPINTLTFFWLPAHELWRTLPYILQFTKETLAFQQRLMAVEGRAG